MNNNDVLTSFLGTVQIVRVPTMDFKRHGRHAAPGGLINVSATRRADGHSQ